VGDRNGVVVIPNECALDLVTGLEQRAAAEADYVAAVARGEFSNAWVDEALAAGGIVTERK
jgi:regulator of RNase E activity RraA